MAGSAILDPSVLLDSLIPVVDDLRRTLHPKFGVRAYSVFTVHRTWSGRSVGEGTSSDVVTEIDPQPRVLKWSGLRYQLEPCGLDELGEIQLREWSISYTEAEVIGPKATMGRNQEWMIRLDEAHGQESRSKLFIHTKPPFIDREKDFGWTCWLRSVQE